ncbi:PUA-like domain-containing protein, partial [Catenaria anguillulae PL171]
MRTYKTTSDVSHLKLPYARVPDPYPTAANRTFGPILGVPVGSLFYFRQDVHHAGIHRGFVAGIFGHEQFGCWSICVNGGYPEDIDEGDRIVFTGSGGRELATKNLRTADQSCDQSPNNKCNASLIKSHATGLPIRVVRGPKSHSPYTPVGAYRYDGLYRCTNWEFATGKTGFRVLRFTLERLEGQTPL